MNKVHDRENFSEHRDSSELRAKVQVINALLNAEFGKAFNLDSRKEYQQAASNDFSNGMKEVVDRVDNLGVLDPEAEDKIAALANEADKTNRLIKEAGPDEMYPVNLFQLMGRLEVIDTTGEVLANLKEIYGIDADSWLGFVEGINMRLRQNIKTLDELSERSEKAVT